MAGYLDDKKKKRANKGSMTKRFFREYVTKTVIPSIKKEEKPALLLLDGHESHIDLECLTMLRDAGIHVIQEPAHCSSAVQVCDQNIFSEFKRGWRLSLNEWYRKNPYKKMTKWLVPYIAAKSWQQAMIPKNIIASWRRACLDPFDIDRMKQKVIDREKKSCYWQRRRRRKTEINWKE